MSKIKTVGTISEFMNARIIKLTQIEKDWTSISKVLGITGGTSLLVMIPEIANAAPQAVEVGVAVANAGDAFDNVYSAIMNGFDSGVVLVIIFAGGAWCLGHRGKAIEILLGVCIGYILARHAIDIRDWLKKI